MAISNDISFDKSLEFQADSLAAKMTYLSS